MKTFDRKLDLDEVELIANALGDGWKAERRNDVEWGVWLAHTDGRELFVQSAQPNDRLEVSVNYPRPPGGQQLRNLVSTTHPTITVGRARRPEAIAREITRRLLPEATEQHAKAVAAIAKNVDDLGNRDRLTAQVVDALGHRASLGRVDERSAHVARFDADTWVTVDLTTGGGGSIEIRLIPADKLVALVTAISAALED